MKHPTILLSLVAMALFPQSIGATTVTQGRLQYTSYQGLEAPYPFFALTLIGEGLNVTMGIGGPSTPGFPSRQPSSCSSHNQLCGPYSLGGNFQTPNDSSFFQWEPFRLASATVGGVTYANVFAIVAGTVQGPSGLSALTTCSSSGAFIQSCSTAWGPFAFTMTGTIQLAVFDPRLGPQILAQDQFQASGLGTSRHAIFFAQTLEQRFTELTFTPEPSSGPVALAALLSVAVVSRAARRWGK